MPSMHDDSRDMPPAPCPLCGHVMDGASEVASPGKFKIDPPLPKPGDLLVCICCGGILRFGNRFQLEALTGIEVNALPGTVRRNALAAQCAIRDIPAHIRKMQ